MLANKLSCTTMTRDSSCRVKHLRILGILLAASSILQSFSNFRGYPSKWSKQVHSQKIRDAAASDSWLYQAFTKSLDPWVDARVLRCSLNASYLRDKPTAVHIVIGFCVHDLDWLHSAFSDIEFANLTIYSKCGKEHIARSFLFDGKWAVDGSVVTLPNIGRIDHTIVYDMLSRPTNTPPDTVIVYVKDTFPVVHQRGLETVPFNDMIYKAAGPLGFGCGLQPSSQLHPSVFCEYYNSSALARVLRFGAFPKRCIPLLRISCHQKLSVWHLTSELESFRLGRHARTDALYNRVDDQDFSTRQTFRSWLKDMQVSLPQPVSTVCYGGSFAVKYSHVLRARVPLLNMNKSLSRGDNILEGHFAERTWAGLLSSRLSPELLKRVQLTSVGILPFPDMNGCLIDCAESLNC